MRVGLAAGLSLVLWFLLPVSAQMTMTGSAAEGRRLFHAPTLGTNGLSCAHCHADFDEERQDDGLIRAGHSLYNAAARETWWGKDPKRPNAYRQIASAAVVCLEHYQRSATRLSAQQTMDLQAYLEAITHRPERAPLSVFPAGDLSGAYEGHGDGNRLDGQPLFMAACHACHPNGGAGIGPAIPRDRDPAFYARKVREGDGLGAVLTGIDPDAYDPAAGLFMPFFGADRLSQRQLRDIIAYIRSLPPLPADTAAKKSGRRGTPKSPPSRPRPR